MWVFTKFGFFSIVVDKQIEGNVLVRARRKEDLHALLVWMGAMPRTGVTETPKADYPARITMPQKTAAKVMMEATLGIDYSNFKDEVRRTQGREREGVYHRVWAVLRETIDDRVVRNKRG